MKMVTEDLSVKLVIGLVMTVGGIILGWLWQMQQQISMQQVTDSNLLGKVSVLENKISDLKEVGSTSAQKALLEVQELEGAIRNFATKEDFGRIEKRLDRIEQKK